MKRFFKILSYLLLGIIILIAAIVIYALNTDFSSWRENIQERMKQELGRSVEIDSLQLNLGAESTLQLRGFRIGDKLGDPLKSLDLGNFELGVNLGPLIFSNRLDITYFNLEDTAIALNTAQQQASTQAEAGTTKEENSTNAKSGGFDPKAFFALPLIRDMQVKNLTLSLYDPASAKPILVDIKSASLSADDPSLPQTLAIEGTADGNPLTFGGQMGSLESLFDKTIPWIIDLSGAFGAAELQIKGQIQDPINLENIDIKVAAYGTELSQMGRLLGIVGKEKIGPWRLGAYIHGPNQANITLDDFEFLLGNQSVNQGNIKLAINARVNRLAYDGRLELAFNGLMDNPILLQSLKQEWKGLLPALDQVPVLPESLSFQGKVQGGLAGGLRLQDLNLRYGDAAKPMIIVSGEVNNLMPPSGIALDTSIDIANFNEFTPSLVAISPSASLPAGVLNLPPLKLKAHIEGALDDRINLSKFELTLGKSDISGDMNVRLIGDNFRPAATVTLQSVKIVLDDFAPLWAGDDSTPKTKPAASKTDGGASDSAPQQAEQDPLASLKLFDLEFDYQISSLLGFGMNFKDLAVDASVQKGILDLKPMLIPIANGTVTLGLLADANQAPTSYQVKLGSDGIDLSALPIAGLEGLKTSAQGGLNSKADLTFQGLESQTMLQSMKGKVDFTLKNLDIGGLSLGGKRLDSNLDNGFTKGLNLTKIDCVSAPIDIAEGKLNFDNGLLGTTGALALFSGSYDLINETVNMRLQPEIANISMPIRLSGAITNPEIKIEGGTGILQLGETLFGDQKNPAEEWQKKVIALKAKLPANHGCQSYLDQRKDQPPPSDTPAANATTKAKEQVNDLLDKNLGKDAAPIKSLLKGIFN